MSALKKRKINQLMLNFPKGAVFLSSWLKERGYGPHLVKGYRNSGWLESIGVDANIRAGDSVDCLGGLYALQAQGKINVHIAGRSAFSFLGKSHYLELHPKKLIIFSTLEHNRLPAWFTKRDWGIKVELHSSNFLPPGMGLVDYEAGELVIKISNETRALMECLYLAPKKQELTECYELMEGMNNLPPENVQKILECCRSIKVKRLFLYLAERIGHRWFYGLDLSRIDVGQGNRNIVQGGILDKKYKITVPRFWSQN